MKKRLSLNDQALVIGGIQGEVQDSFSAEGHRILLQQQPTDLEPVFHHFTLNTRGDLPRFNLQQRPDPRKAVRVVYMQLWFPQENKLKWQEVDFLRELSIVKNPVSFLILGNKITIMHVLGVDPDDVFIAKNVLKSKFPAIECDSGVSPFLKFSNVLKLTSNGECRFGLRDFYPHPAYWRSLSLDENNKSSSLLSLYAGLSSLGNDELGIYQVIIKPTAYPWPKNILSLIETEAEIAKYGNVNLSRWYYQGFGNKEKNKCKLDSPIMAVAIRYAVVSKRTNIEDALNVLSLVFTNFQFSGENLNYLDKTDYQGIINTSEELISWIAAGIVYHSGYLFNTRETLGFFHFPAEEVLRNENYPIDRIAGFKVPQELKQAEGVVIGYNDYAGERVIVKQPENIRSNHTAIEGLINQGKSCLLVNMCLDDIYKGKGAGFIDLHGDALDDITKRIPEERIEDVVYFDPCDDDFELCYNPFKLKEGEDIGKRVDDLVISVRSLYSGRDWGYLIESTLTPVFYTLLKGKNLTLSDARILLSKTKEGYRMRESVLPLIDNQEVKMFWVDLFERLPIPTIQRVLNKLSRFLLPQKVNRIFSQRKNLIDFRTDIIDQKKIFLGYLPVGKLGSDCANILGSTIVSDFHNAGMSRQDIPFSERHPYNLYIDECQRISVKSFEDSLRELRKYNIRLILAYQQKEQLSESIKLALGNVGTMIELGVDWDNAQRVFKEFFGQIEPNDLMRRNTGDGFVKMGNDIISLKTFPLKEVNGNGFRDKIIQHSREHYYVPVVHNKADSDSLLKEKMQSNRKIVYDEI